MKTRIGHGVLASIVLHACTASNAAPDASVDGATIRDGRPGDARSDGATTLDDAISDAAEMMDGSMVGDVAMDAVAGDGSVRTADGQWSPLTVMTVVDPMDHGAVGDGHADDLGALGATISALPAAGGLVYLPAGHTFRKTSLLNITRAHVKFWAPDRQATLLGAVAGQRRRQATICRTVAGCGFFGVKFASDATARFDALEDNQISFDHATDGEVVGCEIAGSAAAGVFVYGGSRMQIVGNYIHHTWADHIHHTDGARTSSCWDNWIFNEAPSNGDDGIACVTYGPSSPRCGDMEWWNNTIVQTGWGRGYSVIGGDAISIHDNWAIRVAGAGIIVASEPGYNSASSDHVTARHNHLYGCSHAIGHPGILVSGLNTAAAPLSDLTFDGNVVVATATGTAYRAEGAYTAVTNTGLSTSQSDLPSPMPGTASVAMRDTTVLATRDVSYVDASHARGLHRIEVRRATLGTGFQQRFEYAVVGPAAAVTAFVNTVVAAGAYASEARVVAGQGYALVLSGSLLVVPATLSGVTFAALRAGDLDGSLSWLWHRIDTQSY